MFSLFLPNEIYFYNDIIEVNDNKDLCFICWMPSEKNNVINKLSLFSDMNISCKCSPKIHKLCLDDWINKNESCPICRTKMYPKKYLKQNHIIIFKYTTYLLLSLFYINLLSLILYFLYNSYVSMFFDYNMEIY